jgi:sugar phosphate isomerase/epimerase
MTADDWKWNADFLNEKAAVLKKAGIVAGYHNHNFEFAPLGNTTGMDILLKGTDPSLVTFEMDVGWVTAAGHDPFAMLKAHPGRFTQMHVKDIKATTKANFELKQDPTEVGSGMIDWKKLLPAAYAAGVRGFYYEQEPPFAHARLESAKISYDYLAKVVA